MNIRIPQIKNSFPPLTRSIIIATMLLSACATTWLGVSYYQKHIFSNHITAITALWQKHLTIQDLQKTPAMNSLHDSLRWIKQEFIKHPTYKKITIKKASWGKLLFEPSYKLLCRILDEEKTISIAQAFLEKIARQVDGIWEEFGDEKDASFDADTFFLASIWRESMYEKLTSQSNTIHKTDSIKTHQSLPFTLTPQKATPFSLNKQKQGIKNFESTQQVKNTQQSQSSSNDPKEKPYEPKHEQYWQTPTQNPYFSMPENQDENRSNNTQNNNDDMSWLSELMADDQTPQQEFQHNKKPIPLVINQEDDDNFDTVINTRNDSFDNDNKQDHEESAQEKTSKIKKIKKQMAQKLMIEEEKAQNEIEKKQCLAFEKIGPRVNEFIKEQKKDFGENRGY